jgi:ATP-dependent DNA helicase RecQ
VREDIARQLKLRDAETIITGFDRKNLDYYVVPVRSDADKDSAIIEILHRYKGVAIVYASTRRNVEKVTRTLEDARIPVAAYHAGLDDAHRHDVQEAFMKESVRAIVATNAFGMGIDKPNVRVVVHHSMPGTLEAYYQEAGRAGRDGQHSDVFLLHAFPDRFTHEFFIKGAYPERSLVEQVYEKLRKRADETGAVDLDPSRLASSLPGKISDREVESALRLLVRAGAIRSDPDVGGQVFVRLLATAERIKTELAEREAQQVGLLRALWRVAGDALYDGVTVDLSALPPGFGGVIGAMELMEVLEAAQFIQWRRVGGGDRITNPRRPLSGFPLDWSAVERRRKAEMSKLDAMQGYAYTTGCRRGFVLRYFGDPAAGKDCGGCDNCLGTHNASLREKRALGVPKASEGRRPRGGARGASRNSTTSEPADAVASPADAALLERLRALRTSIAREQKVPPYVVFADRTLAEMAVRRPKSTFALGEIHGVGPMKIEKYGERFLALLRVADETEAA